MTSIFMLVALTITSLTPATENFRVFSVSIDRGEVIASLLETTCIRLTLDNMDEGRIDCVILDLQEELFTDGFETP